MLPCWLIFLARCRDLARVFDEKGAGNQFQLHCTLKNLFLPLLKVLPYSEVDLEPSQTSKIELFGENK